MFKVDIHIDAETLPPVFNDRDFIIFKNNLKIPGNIKKPETMEKWIEENWEEQYRSLATNTSKASFATLAWNFTRDKSKTTCLINTERNDKAIVETFYKHLKEHVIELSKADGVELSEDDLKDDKFMDYVVINWFGTNIRTFDLDLLWKQCMKHRLYNFARLIPRKKFDDRVIDYVEIYNGPAPHKYISQKEICELFGIQGKPDDIDGSQVYDYWMRGEYEKVAEYNIYDVDRVIDLRKLFNL